MMVWCCKSNRFIVSFPTTTVLVGYCKASPQLEKVRSRHRNFENAVWSNGYTVIYRSVSRLHTNSVHGWKSRGR